MAFVTSVKKYQLTLGVGTAQASIDLDDQTEADCIPFFSYRCTTGIGSGTALDQMCLDVYFNAGQVVAETGSGSTRALAVEVSVVEFDQSKVEVQQGTWSIAASNSSKSETLGSSVTEANTFMVFSYTLDAATTGFSDAAFMGQRSSTQATFSRLGSSGPAASGHYFTAEALSSEFDVVQYTTGVSTATTKNVTTDPDWNSDETAAFSSYYGANTADSLAVNSIYSRPDGDPITGVNSGRGTANGTFNTCCFLVHFTSGNEVVARESTNAATGTTGTRDITSMGNVAGDDLDCSVHSYCQPFLISGYTNNAEPGHRDDYVPSWEFNGHPASPDEDTLRWRRLGDMAGGSIHYPAVQVIKWDVAAGAPATRRVMVIS